MKTKKKQQKTTTKDKKKTPLLTKKIEVFQSNDRGYEEDMQIKMPRYNS